MNALSNIFLRASPGRVTPPFDDDDDDDDDEDDDNDDDDDEEEEEAKAPYCSRLLFESLKMDSTSFSTFCIKLHISEVFAIGVIVRPSSILSVALNAPSV